MSFADAIGPAGTAFIVGGATFLVTGLFTGSPDRLHLSNALYAVGCWIAFVTAVLDGDAFFTAANGLLAAWFTWKWWKNRRSGRGKRALKDLGAKSRARIERLVRQMTPSPIPTPVGGKA